MDEDGNVLIKRTGVSQLSILAAAETGDRRQADMLAESCGHMLGMEKTVELFDMNNFQKLLENSLRYSQGRINKQGLELQVQYQLITIRQNTIAVCLNSVPGSRGEVVTRAPLLDNSHQHGYT